MTTTTNTTTEDLTTTRTMRAVAQDRYGDVDVLAVQHLPIPEPGAGKVLVRVRAAGVDRGVWHLMTGKPALIRVLGFGFRRPKQPVRGGDLAGTVVAVGEGVDRFTPGDEVFGVADGSFAEYAVADADKLAAAPAELSPAESAVLAVSGITALYAVEDVTDVQAGQRVLVLGGSGGVGSYVVQLAAARGAHVTAVASAAKAEFVRGLGAERAVDYRAQDITASGESFDVIIDIGGNTPLRRLRRVLAPTGTLVIVGGEDGGWLTGGLSRQIGASLLSNFTKQKLAFFISPEDSGSMARLAEHVAAGRVRPAVTATYALADAPQAIADLVAGRIAGKAAIEIGAAS